MRILFLGDIVGRSGRDAVAEHLPKIREALKPDIIIINGENAAHGFGITEKICKDLYELGADVITTGNHVWDQREIIPYIDRDKNLLRPLNFPEKTPGSGFVVKTLQDGRKIMVVNVMCRLYMDAIDDPFMAMEKLLGTHKLAANVNAIFVDIHGEATAEKLAFGHFVDGRVTGVVGTHTHIPTADAHVLKKGTAYMTDAGMCGDYDSVIGMHKDIPVQRFIRKMPTERLFPASGEGTVCGTFIVSDDKTGLAQEIRPVRIGATLQATAL